MSEQELGEFDIVYLGATILKSGALGMAVIPTSALERAEGDDAAEIVRRARSAYKGKDDKVVGGIYTAKGTLEGDSITRLNLSTMKFRRRSGHPLVSTWELESRAEKALHGSLGVEKKLRASPRVMKEIAALGAIYYQTNQSLRPALEGAILDIIRRESAAISRAKLAARIARDRLS